MARMKVTVVGFYEADPEHYRTSDPVEMAAIDFAAVQDSPEEAAYLMDLTAGVAITVEPA